MSIEMNLLSPNPVTRPEGNEIAQLIEVAKDLRLRGREYRIATGRVLLQLRNLLAKPGCGDYMRVLREEIRIPYTTANDYIEEALAADGHLEYSESAPQEIAPYDSASADIDPVEIAINDARDEEEQARKLENNPLVLRDYNWKFRLISFEKCQQLKAAKAACPSSHDIAELLILGSQLSTKDFAKLLMLLQVRTQKEVSNEKIAA